MYVNKPPVNKSDNSRETDTRHVVARNDTTPTH